MDAGSYVNLMYVREDREVGGNIQLESKKKVQRITRAGSTGRKNGTLSCFRIRIPYLVRLAKPVG
jgi:hypothetical protein